MELEALGGEPDDAEALPTKGKGPMALLPPVKLQRAVPNVLYGALHHQLACPPPLSITPMLAHSEGGKREERKERGEEGERRESTEGVREAGDGRGLFESLDPPP